MVTGNNFLEANTMCGRFARYQKPSVYAELFGVESIPAGPI
jgi:hypothetical protein